MTTGTKTMSPVMALVAANLKVLQQGQLLLTKIDDLAYARVVTPLFDYGVGSHIRHCLDSFACFFKGLESGLIDYDQRERDNRMASDRNYAQNRIANVMLALENVAPDLSATVLQARQDSAFWTVTSLERELQFLLSHTVHHYALIALMLRAQGIEPGADFGVAPSTLEFWQQNFMTELAA